MHCFQVEQPKHNTWNSKLPVAIKNIFFKNCFIFSGTSFTTYEMFQHSREYLNVSNVFNEILHESIYVP